MNYPGATATASHLPHSTQLHGGTFVIGAPLGQGGCGITYRGEDINLRRAVAIKEFFPPECARSGNSVISPSSSADYAAAREQFLEEARALARFAHRNIVNVLLVFEENNTAYMVMEFLKGKNLQQLVEDAGPLPEKQALGHIEQMAGALAVVHQAGFIHRDIKPANAIVCDDGRVVLIDFGLNKKVEVAQTYHTRVLTRAAPTGTEGYAPPEQYLKGSIQGMATDIYALGATLYFLVTGEVPVSAPERAMGAPFRAPANVNPSVSQSFSDAIMRALELNEKARPQSVQELMKTLTARPQVTPQVTSLAPKPHAPGPVPTVQSPIPAPPPRTTTPRTAAPPTAQPVPSANWQPPPSPPSPTSPTSQMIRCPHCTAMNPVMAKQCSVCNVELSKPAYPPIWDRSPFLYHLSLLGITLVMTILFVLWAFNT